MEIPLELTDPLSGKIFKYPVKLPNDNVYEMNELCNWFQRNKNIDPLTGKEIIGIDPLSGKEIIGYDYRYDIDSSMFQKVNDFLDNNTEFREKQYKFDNYKFDEFEINSNNCLTDESTINLMKFRDKQIISVLIKYMQQNSPNKLCEMIDKIDDINKKLYENWTIGNYIIYIYNIKFSKLHKERNMVEIMNYLKSKNFNFNTTESKLAFYSYKNMCHYSHHNDNLMELFNFLLENTNDLSWYPDCCNYFVSKEVELKRNKMIEEKIEKQKNENSNV